MAARAWCVRGARAFLRHLLRRSRPGRSFPRQGRGVYERGVCRAWAGAACTNGMGGRGAHRRQQRSQDCESGWTRIRQASPCAGVRSLHAERMEGEGSRREGEDGRGGEGSRREGEDGRGGEGSRREGEDGRGGEGSRREGEDGRGGAGVGHPRLACTRVVGLGKRCGVVGSQLERVLPGGAWRRGRGVCVARAPPMAPPTTPIAVAAADFGSQGYSSLITTSP